MTDETQTDHAPADNVKPHGEVVTITLDVWNALLDRLHEVERTIGLRRQGGDA